MHAWPYALLMIWMATWLSIVAGLVGSLIWFFWTSSQGQSESGESAETILKQRYAKGEIETEEYERRLSELKKTKIAA